MESRKTPFYDIHTSLKGKIIDFGGWLMPVQFEGIKKEHLRVRNTVGLFDVSHMGEIEVSGKDDLAFVNYVITNDASKLAIGQVLYTASCYNDGGIVDDLLVYRYENKYLLVVNASNTTKDYEWYLSQKGDYDIEIINKSDEIAQLALQGPKTEDVLRKITTINLTEIPFYWFKEGKVANCDNVLLSRTGYTGEDGFELYFPNEYAKTIWDAIMEAGKEFDIQPIGLGARDTLRLEMKYCLYGNDIDKTTNPLEAGLGWAVKLDKEDFIGKEIIEKIKKEKPSRRLICFVMSDKGIPRQHYKIMQNDIEIGEVTSGTFSPSLNKGIGLAYIKRGHTKAKTEIDIIIRNKPHKALIIKPPFYKDGTRK